MAAYGTFETKNRLSELIELAERGEEVVITRHGKPVVQLVKIEETAEEKRKKAEAAVEWIRANRPKTGGLSVDEIKAYIAEGRR
jgi:prevent-host-death family protein